LTLQGIALHPMATRPVPRRFKTRAPTRTVNAVAVVAGDEDGACASAGGALASCPGSVAGGSYWYSNAPMSRAAAPSPLPSATRGLLGTRQPTSLW
jgi:hypothetical protein